MALRRRAAYFKYAGTSSQVQFGMAIKRTWIRLGTTTIDLDPVVKIVFDRADARMFVSAGEALLMAAWTKERADITKLKEFASPDNGWIDGKSDALDNSAVNERIKLSSIDKVVLVETSLGSVVELFARGVFLGQVAGPDAIAAVEQRLGITQ